MANQIGFCEFFVRKAPKKAKPGDMNPVLPVVRGGSSLRGALCPAEIRTPAYSGRFVSGIAAQFELPCNLIASSRAELAPRWLPRKDGGGFIRSWPDTTYLQT
jgi:hypothetical protein